MNIIPSITNVLSLIFLILFIYSALGISLYSTVKYGDNYNETYNFRNVFHALLLLMRCSTGEDWNAVMRDLIVKDDCS